MYGGGYTSFMNTTTKTETARKETAAMTTASTLSPSALEIVRLSLIGAAASQMAAYPQYAGHFDGYQVARATKTVKTKMGLAWNKGELLIYKTESRDIGRGPEICFTAYSVRNRCDTGIPRACLEML